jgi:hypothetical protein
MDGELHREGPSAVMPVFLRALFATLLLMAPWTLRLATSDALLASLNVPWRISALWMDALAGPCLAIAIFLLTRPIKTQGADAFGLGIHAPMRKALSLAGLPWLLYSLLMVLAIQAAATSAAALNSPIPVPQATPGTTREEMLIRIAAAVAVIAQTAWLLVMRHSGRVGDYLRDSLIHRSATTWGWLWGLFMALYLPYQALKLARNAPGVDASVVAETVLAMSRAGLLWGLAGVVMLWWYTAHALTLAYTELDREDLRAQRERERYRTPE